MTIHHTHSFLFTVSLSVKLHQAAQVSITQYCVHIRSRRKATLKKHREGTKINNILQLNSQLHELAYQGDFRLLDHHYS